MKRNRALWGMLAAAMVLLPACLDAKELLHYEPAVVRLSGNVVVEPFYGRPNYGEDPEHDEMELSPILILDSPVDVAGDPNDDLNSETVQNVTRMHLVLKSRRQIRELKGHHVALEGTLFHAFSGHHHTDVLMRVEKATIDR